MPNRWRPLKSVDTTYNALVDGVPAYLVKPLFEWIDEVVARFHETGFMQRPKLAAEFDVLARNPHPLATRADRYFLSSLLAETNDQQLVLDFAEYTLAKLGEAGWLQYTAPLDEMLLNAGSKWKVGTRRGLPGFELRVPEGVSAASDAVIATSGGSGALLAEAWRAAFGRGPDPEEAYEKAIKAVEEAGARVVAPKSSLATLGAMARDMESQKDWKLPLVQSGKHPTDAVATMMVRALWEGQESRHGGNGYRKPTQAEAEAAVLLAVPLVQWFTTGTLKRR